MIGYNLASVSPLLPPLPFLNFFILHFPCRLCCQQLQADSLHVVGETTGSLVFTASDLEAERAFCQHLHVGYHKRTPAGPTWSLCLESTPEKGKWDTRIARLSQKPVWCLRTGFPEVTIQPESRGMEGNVLGGKRSVRTHRIRNWRARGQQRYCRSSRERTDHRSPLTLPQER